MCVVGTGNSEPALCLGAANAHRQRPPLQIGTMASVSATGYSTAKPIGNRSEAVSMFGVFLLWHLWSNNNPQRKGYQCFLETHDRVCNLSPSTASKLLHTQDDMHPHSRNDIPNRKHNSLFLWSPCTLKISLFQRRLISFALSVLVEEITERVGGRSTLVSEDPSAQSWIVNRRGLGEILRLTAGKCWQNRHFFYNVPKASSPHASLGYIPTHHPSLQSCFPLSHPLRPAGKLSAPGFEPRGLS